jgi:hypothetical protein
MARTWPASERYGLRQVAIFAPATLVVERMGPAVKIHHVPKIVLIELVEIGDDGDEDALDSLIVQRPREMMMVDEKSLLPRSEDDGDHMPAEEIDQLFAALRPPGLPLERNLDHP